jgi:hypothetical protein
MGSKFQRKVDRLKRDNVSLQTQNRELREAVELLERLLMKYKAFLKRRM